MENSVKQKNGKTEEMVKQKKMVKEKNQLTGKLG